MIHKRTAIVILICCSVLIFSLLGCSSQRKQPTDLLQHEHTQPLDHNSDQHAAGHKPPVNHQQEGSDSHKPATQEDVEAQHNPSPEESGEQGQSHQNDDPSSDAPHDNESSDDANSSQQGDADDIAYNPAQPMLLGLTIGQPKALITEKFGSPLEQFVMEDPSDPITVYEYDGFLVGYNKLNLIQFIDINAREIDSGLNGLRLNDSLEDAIRALGNPDSRTPYVLNYYSKEAVLKLDLNPLTNTITSIKLFGSNH